ncbi:MAG: DUF4180 domain-containing protein [Acidobacteria bacterium]|nr:MAG: DUF4180 domain-containing protein [Acidobacteriota bacterium]REK07287.1 MAG: DUF4180 domain-containing protein [Acidobacteriota bacterium]
MNAGTPQSGALADGRGPHEPAGEEIDARAAVRECIEAGRSGLLLDAARLPPAFFDLSTRLAGEVTHQTGVYHVPIAIFGVDVEGREVAGRPIASRSLWSWIHESRGSSTLRFFARREEALEWLSAP